MIIERFSAENIYKYTRIELGELPPRALIGVSGPNESGKSALAEGICLALHGRTFALAGTAITKAIKWGSPSARLALSFRNRSGDRFTVTRFLDMDGNHSARLSYGDAQTALVDGVEAVAEKLREITGYGFEHYVDAFYLAQRELTAPHAQSDMIKTLLGVVDLDRVADSLQVEIDQGLARLADLEAESAATELRITELDFRPAVLSQLERDRADTSRRLEYERERLRVHQDRAATVTQAVAEVAVAAEDLSTLPDSGAYTEWQRRTANFREPLDRLAEALAHPEPVDLPPARTMTDVWQDLAPRLRRFAAIRAEAESHRAALASWLQGSGSPASTGEDPPAPATTYQRELGALTAQTQRKHRRRRRARFATVTFAAIATLGIGIWWAASQAPGNGWLAALSDWGAHTLPGADLNHASAVAAAAVVGLILALMSYARAQRLGEELGALDEAATELGNRAARARTEIELLGDLDSLSVAEQIERFEQVTNDGVVQASTAFSAEEGAPLMDATALQAYLQPLAAARAGLREAQPALAARLQQEVRDAEAAVADQEERLAVIEGGLIDERARREELAGLETEREALAAATAGPRHQIAVRRAGRELIAGTVRRVYALFNQQMQAFLATLLPLFTDGRYRHLKLDNELNIAVFSAERNDFVGVDDLSSGAHRQLLLALRLAFSQALVESRVRGPQSLILDEPFAFFDRERMGQFLSTLPQFSRGISQIWVISQEFAAEVPFDLHIRCQRDSDTLALGAA
jgi:exonuclease SbcC